MTPSSAIGTYIRRVMSFQRSSSAGVRPSCSTSSVRRKGGSTDSTSAARRSVHTAITLV
jgi:hypothetical protein